MNGSMIRYRTHLFTFLVVCSLFSPGLLQKSEHKSEQKSWL
nr:MAG TPA: hypothetical protein [Caudoviricetes sp.]